MAYFSNLDKNETLIKSYLDSLQLQCFEKQDLIDITRHNLIRTLVNKGDYQSACIYFKELVSENAKNFWKDEINCN